MEWRHFWWQNLSCLILLWELLQRLLLRSIWRLIWILTRFIQRVSELELTRIDHTHWLRVEKLRNLISTYLVTFKRLFDIYGFSFVVSWHLWHFRIKLFVHTFKQRQTALLEKILICLMWLLNNNIFNLVICLFVLRRSNVTWRHIFRAQNNFPKLYFLALLFVFGAWVQVVSNFPEPLFVGWWYLLFVLADEYLIL